MAFFFGPGYSLAAALAGPALRANSAGAGANDFFAAAVRAGNIHEHVAERLLHTVGVRVAVPYCLRLTFV